MALNNEDLVRGNVSGLANESIGDILSAVDNKNFGTPGRHTGSFGETKFSVTLGFFKELKKRLTKGELSFSDYLDVSAKLNREVQTDLRNISGGGNDAANIGRAEFAKFTQGNFIKDVNDFDPGIPFTRREFSQLPEKSLPSLDDVNKGLVPPELLPPGGFERIQRVENDRISAERQRQQPTTPLPGVTPGQPAEPAQPLLPGQVPTNTAERFIQDPQDPTRQIPIPIVGDVTEPVVSLTQDQRLIESEARRQEEQQRRAFEAARGLREQGLQDTASLLAQNRQQSFQDFVPQAAEQLQTRGLLQTSELENSLAKEQGRLQSQSEQVLGAAKLAGNQSEIDQINQILASRQGLQQAGLERSFATSDFDKQSQLARQLGAQITPEVGSGGGSRLSGTLQGAIGGASAGAAGGPIGSLAGGLLGGAAGNASAQGK